MTASQPGADRNEVLTSVERADGATVCVVGLGYVGLPLAVAFDRAGHAVVGYDVDTVKVGRLADGTDTTGDLGDDQVADSDVSFTADPALVATADYVVITVPTPLGEGNIPDLSAVEAAAGSVGEHLSPGTTVVLESTVYPGATREVLVPAIEDASGFTCGEEFAVGYSPERASPGDADRGLDGVVKIVSGQTDRVRAELAELYRTVADEGVYEAPSIEAAEAAKVFENVQRDVNIALMNELAMACDHIGVDVHAALEAAGTKWNFHDEYRPGLVGGHCIPIDPHYLAHRAEQAGFTTDLLLTSRRVNESVPGHVADLALRALNERGKVLGESRLLLLGVTYKPNVGDIRDSKVADIAAELRTFDVSVQGYDPHADPAEVRRHVGLDLQSSLAFDGFDGVVVATPHDAFAGFDLDAMAEALADAPVLVDVSGLFDADEARAAGFDYRRL
ncbi:nucleotide sugar dehydrogenase [Halorarius halobius]|uniref:nucleotide sugar dehydrogenase n=1 Tax=Halorarius halobius TaxID=2962671 RepID=UPI0020CC12BF|nr:nucleotide sugar dehydrogenase [Halorarius halobius]